MLQSSDFTEARLDRRTSHYWAPVELARRVLSWQGVAPSVGDANARTFLLRSPKMIETGLRQRPGGPSLLKVCWPLERRPHVEQPAVAYRVKRAEVVHALTALVRPQEHIVVNR